MSAQPPLVVSAEDRLEATHLVRHLYGLVECTLVQRLRSGISLKGGFSYDPVRLLCVWLYGFLQGERSSRRLEELCRYDVRYEFLAGSCKPDHTTLSRFRSSMGQDLDQMLLLVSREAERAGVLKRVSLAVDGTKVQARLSQWRKARQESEQTDAALEEAVTMVSHGKFLVGYNVQAAVDMDSGIVAGYVVSDQPEDKSQMAAVLDAVKAQSGDLSQKVVADRGYSSTANATALAERGVNGYMLEPVRGRRAPFVQDEGGVFRCKAGHVPTERPWVDSKRQDKLYRNLRVSCCSGCELAQECPGKGRQRSMKVLHGRNRRAPQVRPESPL
jgi:transposase